MGGEGPGRRNGGGGSGLLSSWSCVTCMSVCWSFSLKDDDLPVAEPVDGADSEGDGAKPGAEDPIRGNNSYRRVDHIFVTMSQLDAAAYSKEDTLNVVLAAFKTDITSAKKNKLLKGVVCDEYHADGSIHRHHAVINGCHVDARTMIKRLASADIKLRGWETKPTYEDAPARKGGGKGSSEAIRSKAVRGSGKRFHLNMCAFHPLSAADALKQKKKAGSFKAPWSYNKMVEYVLDPKKSKQIDKSPLFFNCTAKSVYIKDVLEDSRMVLVNDLLAPPNFASLMAWAIEKKKEGMSKEKFLLELAKRVDSRRCQWMFWGANRGYECSEVRPKVKFLPKGFAEGDLSVLKPAQLECIKWVEVNEINNLDILWIQAESGFGKTTLQKMIMIRYEGTIYILKVRGAKGTYDRVSLLGYDESLKIMLINDLVPDRLSRDRVQWNWVLIQFLKIVNDGMPISIIFGSDRQMVTPSAKIIITSTHAPPEDRELQRRIHHLFVKEDGTYGWMAKPKKEEQVGCEEWIAPTNPNIAPYKIWKGAHGKCLSLKTKSLYWSKRQLLDIKPPNDGTVERLKELGPWYICNHCSIMFSLVYGDDEQIVYCDVCDVCLRRTEDQSKALRCMSEGYESVVLIWNLWGADSHESPVKVKDKFPPHGLNIIWYENLYASKGPVTDAHEKGCMACNMCRALWTFDGETLCPSCSGSMLKCKSAQMDNLLAANWRFSPPKLRPWQQTRRWSSVLLTQPSQSSHSPPSSGPRQPSTAPSQPPQPPQSPPRTSRTLKRNRSDGSAAASKYTLTTEPVSCTLGSEDSVDYHGDEVNELVDGLDGLMPFGVRPDSQGARYVFPGDNADAMLAELNELSPLEVPSAQNSPTQMDMPLGPHDVFGGGSVSPTQPYEPLVQHDVVGGGSIAPTRTHDPDRSPVVAGQTQDPVGIKRETISSADLLTTVIEIDSSDESATVPASFPTLAEFLHVHHHPTASPEEQPAIDWTALMDGSLVDNVVQEISDTAPPQLLMPSPRRSMTLSPSVLGFSDLSQPSVWRNFASDLIDAEEVFSSPPDAPLSPETPFASGRRVYSLNDPDFLVHFPEYAPIEPSYTSPSRRLGRQISFYEDAQPLTPESPRQSSVPMIVAADAAGHGDDEDSAAVEGSGEQGSPILPLPCEDTLQEGNPFSF